MEEAKIKLQDLIGQRVCVTQNRLGTLRYYGSVQFAAGNWCGIELDSPDGDNDGFIYNWRYFTCNENHGVFYQESEILANYFLREVNYCHEASASKISSNKLSVDSWLDDSIGKNIEKASSVCISEVDADYDSDESLGILPLESLADESELHSVTYFDMLYSHQFPKSGSEQDFDKNSATENVNTITSLVKHETSILTEGTISPHKNQGSLNTTTTLHNPLFQISSGESAGSPKFCSTPKHENCYEELNSVKELIPISHSNKKIIKDVINNRTVFLRNDGLHNEKILSTQNIGNPLDYQHEFNESFSNSSDTTYLFSVKKDTPVLNSALNISTSKECEKTFELKANRTFDIAQSDSCDVVKQGEDILNFTYSEELGKAIELKANRTFDITQFDTCDVIKQGEDILNITYSEKRGKAFELEANRTFDITQSDSCDVVKQGEDILNITFSEKCGKTFEFEANRPFGIAESDTCGVVKQSKDILNVTLSKERGRAFELEANKPFGIAESDSCDIVKQDIDISLPNNFKSKLKTFTLEKRVDHNTEASNSANEKNTAPRDFKDISTNTFNTTFKEKSDHRSVLKFMGVSKVQKVAIAESKDKSTLKPQSKIARRVEISATAASCSESVDPTHSILDAKKSDNKKIKIVSEKSSAKSQFPKTLRSSAVDRTCRSSLPVLKRSSPSAVSIKEHKISLTGRTSKKAALSQINIFEGRDSGSSYENRKQSLSSRGSYGNVKKQGCLSQSENKKQDMKDAESKTCDKPVSSHSNIPSLISKKKGSEETAKTGLPPKRNLRYNFR